MEFLKEGFQKMGFVENYGHINQKIILIAVSIVSISFQLFPRTFAMSTQRLKSTYPPFSLCS